MLGELEYSGGGEPLCVDQVKSISKLQVTSCGVSHMCLACIISQAGQLSWEQRRAGKAA